MVQASQVRREIIAKQVMLTGRHTREQVEIVRLGNGERIEIWGLKVALASYMPLHFDDYHELRRGPVAPLLEDPAGGSL
jgi:hypothetical protein